jgi:hypothetical protein
MIVGFIASFVGACLRIAGSVAAAMVPRRYWAALECHVPVHAAAAWAGVATFLSAGAVGGPNYLTYVNDQVRVFNDVAINSNGYAAAGSGPFFLVLALFTFLFFTPIGWLTIYLGVTGFLRSIAGWLEDGFGDPILTMIDSRVRVSFLSWQVRVRLRQRVAREGPEIPDRVVSAPKMGMDGADLVIVASRSKPGWDKGTIVITPSGAYRLGQVEERMVGGKLRTLYPLKAHTDQEVFRRVVNYELARMQDQPRPPQGKPKQV